MIVRTIKNLFSETFKSKFGKSIVLITGAGVFAQAINLLLTPVITRLYTPEEYGLLSIYTALIAIIGIIGALSYELSIPLAEDDEKAVNILILCIIVLLILTALITTALFFFGEVILGLFNAEELLEYKYFISLGFFFTVLFKILTKWALRKKNFTAISKTRYLQSISGNIAKIGFGVLSFGPIGLLIGDILKRSAGILTLAKPLYKEQGELLKKASKEEIIQSARRYIQFPLYYASSSFLNALSVHLPIFFLTILFGAEMVGQYGLAKGVTFLPVSVIGYSITNVFLGEAASINRNNTERIKILLKKLFVRFFLLSIIPTIILLLSAPLLFSLVFGENWYEAGIYSRLLVIYFFSYLIFQPISSVVFIVMEKQKIKFLIDTIKLVVVLIVFGASKNFLLNSYLTVFIFSLSFGAIEFARFLFSINILNKVIKNKKENYEG